MLWRDFALWRRSISYLKGLPGAPHPSPLPEGRGHVKLCPLRRRRRGERGRVKLRPLRRRSRGGRGQRGRRRRLPPQERGTPAKASPKSREETQVATFDAAFL